MSNMIDYLDWRGDLSFSQSPFNEVDNALLATFSYVRLLGIVPEDESAITLKKAHERYYQRTKNVGEMMSPPTLLMFDKMAASARFGNLFLSGFRDFLSDGSENSSSEQFAAVTIHLPDGTNYIAFRGTDETLAGWKEDLYLTMQETIPSQRRASAYLSWAAEHYCGNFMLGGHSKGGNLAIYAAASASPEVQDRILTIWNNDGPGFHEDFIETPAYQAVKDRIRSVKPEYSIIGGFFLNEGAVSYVRTSAFGVAAHHSFTWNVLGDHFETAPNGLHPGSRVFDAKMEEALADLDDTQRRRFISDLFDSLQAGGSETLSDLSKLKPLQLAGVMRSVTKGAELQHFLKMLIELYIRDFREYISGKGNGTNQ